MCIGFTYYSVFVLFGREELSILFLSEEIYSFKLIELA